MSVGACYVCPKVDGVMQKVNKRRQVRGSLTICGSAAHSIMRRLKELVGLVQQTVFSVSQ